MYQVTKDGDEGPFINIWFIATQADCVGALILDFGSVEVVAVMLMQL